MSHRKKVLALKLLICLYFVVELTCSAKEKEKGLHAIWLKYIDLI